VISRFNQPVDNLPQSITHLIFGRLFNQTVNNLPQTMTHLTFGHNFNQTVDNLPKNIIQLTLNPMVFTQSMNNISPNTEIFLVN
jgi:hypothetical protein